MKYSWVLPQPDSPTIHCSQWIKIPALTWSHYPPYPATRNLALASKVNRSLRPSFSRPAGALGSYTDDICLLQLYQVYNDNPLVPPSVRRAQRILQTFFQPLSPLLVIHIHDVKGLDLWLLDQNSVRVLQAMCTAWSSCTISGGGILIVIRRRRK